MYQSIPCKVNPDGTVTISAFTIPCTIEPLDALDAEYVIEDVLDAEIVG